MSRHFLIFSIVAFSLSAMFILFATTELTGQMSLKALPDDPMATDVDRDFMGRAYEIARNAISRGNQPFSSILVHEGKIIAEFENTVDTTGDVTKHAETGLLSLASPKFSKEVLSQSVLYASTEPCVMCCGAIDWAGIPRVVYGTRGGAVRQMRELLSTKSDAPPTWGQGTIPIKEVFQRINPNVKVVGPVMEEEGFKVGEAWLNK